MNMSLEQKHKKIKLFAFFIISLSISAFLGQMLMIYYKYNQNENKIEIVQSDKVRDLKKENGQNTNSFYIAASKSGTKFYYQNYAGLNRIKPENLVYFTSEEAALAKGYELAKNCNRP